MTMSNDFNDLPGYTNPGMKQEYRSTIPTTELEKRIITQLKEKGMLSAPLYQRKFSFLFTGVLVIFFFLLGFFLAKPVGPGGKEQYLLLLHNPPGFINDKGQAREYGEWLAKLAANGTPVSGEELQDRSVMLTALNSSLPIADKNTGNNGISGFFIITAGSEKEALVITKSCPHLKYKGVIEIRRIIHP